MDNNGAEVIHRNRRVGPRLDLLREKGRAHVEVQSPVQVQTMDLTPSGSNALPIIVIWGIEDIVKLAGSSPELDDFTIRVVDGMGN